MIFKKSIIGFSIILFFIIFFCLNKFFKNDYLNSTNCFKILKEIYPCNLNINDENSYINIFKNPFIVNLKNITLFNKTHTIINCIEYI
jgi:hypothetical protein